LEIEAKQLAFAHGMKFLMNTNTATPSAISGTPINKSSPQKPIGVPEKQQEKRPTSNDRTTRYANELAGTFDKRCPFPNLMSIMTWLPSGLLFSIIWAYHLPSNHYPHTQSPQTSADHRWRAVLLWDGQAALGSRGALAPTTHH